MTPDVNILLYGLVETHWHLVQAHTSPCRVEDMNSLALSKRCSLLLACCTSRSTCSIWHEHVVSQHMLWKSWSWQIKGLVKTYCMVFVV